MCDHVLVCLQEEAALVKASKAGDAERVSRLLANGHDPTVRDAKGRSPYQLAANKEVWGRGCGPGGGGDSKLEGGPCADEWGVGALGCGDRWKAARRQTGRGVSASQSERHRDGFMTSAMVPNLRHPSLSRLVYLPPSVPACAHSALQRRMVCQWQDQQAWCCCSVVLSCRAAAVCCPCHVSLLLS